MDEIQKRGEIEALKEHAKALVEETKNKNTERTYGGAWRRFEAWAEDMGLDSLPASKETVGAYITGLDKRGLKPASISIALTAINQKHVLAGFETILDKRISKIIEGSRIRHGTRQRQVSPITVVHLKQMLKWCDRDFPGVRNKALLLVGFCLALRRSELVALDVEDFEERADGLVVTIKRSKTDQLGKGYKLALPFLDNRDLCPVMALRRWLQVANITEGAIFRRVRRGSKGALFAKTYERMNSKSIARIIKKIAAEAGYDASQFSGHSLRAGLATSAAEAGISERAIMAVTGHESEETVRKYIRDGRIFADNPIRDILK